MRNIVVAVTLVAFGVDRATPEEFKTGYVDAAPYRFVQQEQRLVSVDRNLVTSAVRSLAGERNEPTPCHRIPR